MASPDTASPPRATTIRLPDDLHRRLADYCDRRGATLNRVVAIALRGFLDDDAPPPLHLGDGSAGGGR